MNPLVSIIMPVYNAEKYVIDAIQSVFAQTYKNIELIVVNDGSTDQSKKKILDCFTGNRSSIRTYYHYQENQGPSATRNFGVEQAKGKYIALLDADDLYHPEKIGKQVTYLECNAHIDITYNDIQVVDTNLHKLNILRSEGNFPDRETFLANLLFRQIIPAPAGIMLRRECFQKVTYNTNLVYAEDYDFLIRLAELFNFGYEPGTFYICRRHAENLTNAHDKQVASERAIIQALGVEKIEKIVFASVYSKDEQVLMCAKIMHKIGYYEKAKQFLLSILESTMNPYVFFYLGNISFQNYQYEVAIHYYEESLRFDQELAEVYNNLGCSYLALAKNNLAKECFAQALKLRSNYQDAMFNIRAVTEKKSNTKFTERELRKQLLDYQNDDVWGG